jgi:hypothetical protein
MTLVQVPNDFDGALNHRRYALDRDSLGWYNKCSKNQWHWGSLESQAERATTSVADPLNLTWVMPA